MNPDSIKKAHRHIWVCYILAAASALSVFFINDLDEIRLGIVGIIFGIFYMSGYIRAIRFHRCPECDQILPVHIRLTQKCPHCGAKIDYSIEPEN